MQRFGPLSEVAGGVAVGDPGGKHLLLTAAGVIYRGEAGGDREFAWPELDAITMDLPTSRFRAPAVVATLAFGLITLLSMQVADGTPDEGAVTLRVGGAEHRLPLTRHHVGGYWRCSVQAAQRLLNRLVTDPPERELLRDPDALVRAVGASARRGEQ